MLQRKTAKRKVLKEQFGANTCASLKYDTETLHQTLPFFSVIYEAEQRQKSFW